MTGVTATISNTDATTFMKSLQSNSIQCIICDPPFGINEDGFDSHYARDATNVVEGYQTAPADPDSYREWASSWLAEVPRILRADGTLYVVCAWNHVCDIELALRSCGLIVLNHIIWKYNFGVYTRKKFVTSHYHILRCGVQGSVKGAKGGPVPAFYSRAVFNESDKTADGKSAQYADMEDVWVIPKEYAQGEKKNINKLPDALVRKMIQYSSKPGDVVGDFFLGNFTTAYVAIREGRSIVGCEINSHIYEEHSDRVRAAAVAYAQQHQQQNPQQHPQQHQSSHEKPSTRPAKAGTRITDDEKVAIATRYDALHATLTKKDSMLALQQEFERGHFSILNILKSLGR
jgi:site-specific DNA-methyltransferase (adenine-specific)